MGRTRNGIVFFTMPARVTIACRLSLLASRALRTRKGFLFWRSARRFCHRISSCGLFHITPFIASDFGKKAITNDGSRRFDGNVVLGGVRISVLDEQPRPVRPASITSRSNEYP